MKLSGGSWDQVLEFSQKTGVWNTELSIAGIQAIFEELRKAHKVRGRSRMESTGTQGEWQVVKLSKRQECGCGGTQFLTLGPQAKLRLFKFSFLQCTLMRRVFTSIWSHSEQLSKHLWRIQNLDAGIEYVTDVWRGHYFLSHCLRQLGLWHRTAHILAMTCHCWRISLFTPTVSPEAPPHLWLCARSRWLHKEFSAFPIAEC